MTSCFAFYRSTLMSASHCHADTVVFAVRAPPLANTHAAVWMGGRVRTVKVFHSSAMTAPVTIAGCASACRTAPSASQWTETMAYMYKEHIAPLILFYLLNGGSHETISTHRVQIGLLCWPIEETDIQVSKLLYYHIRELKTWLNINHITVHNNTYFIL